jgi:hypothetical protein
LSIALVGGTIGLRQSGNARPLQSTCRTDRCEEFTADLHPHPIAWITLCPSLQTSPVHIGCDSVNNQRSWYRTVWLHASAKPNVLDESVYARWYAKQLTLAMAQSPVHLELGHCTQAPNRRNSNYRMVQAGAM